jgi:hypothetical protein
MPKKSWETWVLCCVFVPILYCSCSLSVGSNASSIAVTSITLDKTSAALAVGSTIQLTATIAPSDATNKKLSWSTSKASVAVVSATGLVSGISAGSATITATSADGGLTASCAVTVTVVAVGGISLNESSSVVLLNGTDQLVVAFTPTNATNKTVTWSSDSSAATVSQSGQVAGQSVGTANITATSVDGGYSASCAVTVVNASEGSVAAPVSLTVDSLWAGKVGVQSTDDHSYYSFRTGSGLDYRLALSSITPSPSAPVMVMLYSIPSFAGLIRSTSVTTGSSASFDATLVPSTTYYLMVQNSAANGALNFGLKVGSITPGILPADGAWKSGSIDIPGTYAWYSATVVGGQTYALNWDDAYQGSGNYTLDVSVSAYQSDRSTAYFTQQDSGYNQQSTQVIIVPAGQTKLYVKVESYVGTNRSGSFALKLSLAQASGSLAITLQ